LEFRIQQDAFEKLMKQHMEAFELRMQQLMTEARNEQKQLNIELAGTERTEAA